MSAFTDGADVRAANSDIGEQVVVERHQLVTGALSAPPIGNGFPGRVQQV